MSDEVRVSMHVVPVEELANENAGMEDVLASEVNRTLGAEATIAITNYGQTAAVQGFKDAAPYYVEALDDADTTDLSAETAAKVVYIENTGKTYSSHTALGATLDASVKVMISTTMISIIPSYGAITLYDQNGSLNCTTIHIRTVTDVGGTSSSTGHLAVKFLAVK